MNDKDEVQMRCQRPGNNSRKVAQVPNKELQPRVGMSATGKVAIPPTPTRAKLQKIQVLKSSKGDLQVRGLLPGQKLIQMPDGKLQIYHTSGRNETITID